MRRVILLFFALGLAAACGSSSSPDVFYNPFDAGQAPVDGGQDVYVDSGSPDADPNLGGPCVDDKQCDDSISCTFDKCDQELHRCRNIPDDSLCDDGVYCNGREVCSRTKGCMPGPVVTCADGNSCTIDSCDEQAKACVHAPRDLDLDGDPDDHCVEDADCNDVDPTISSTRSEVCGNGRDDNCNGLVDEASCVTPAADVCSSALVITAPGTYALSTAGANKDYATTCSVQNPTAARDVVAAITIPEGGNKDLEVWATTPGTEVAVAIQETCGTLSTEKACGSGAWAWSVRARARNLAPGTYYVIVTTQNESTAELKVSFLDPTTKPTNESCTSPTPITVGTPFDVSLIDPTLDLPGYCSWGIGELTYSFTLTEPQDVRVFASTTLGSGSVIVGLRNEHCTDFADELRCRSGSTLPVFARNLPAGTYIVSVSASSPVDASVLVRTYPPTTAPADQTCATAPDVVVNDTMVVDLADHEDAIKDGCFTGAPNAAYALELTEPSDVMLVGRFPLNDFGSVSLDTPMCGPSDTLACGISSTPARVSRRNVPAGDYRVVITDYYGQKTTLTTLVRPTVPPTAVSGADKCATAFEIPATGGFFTGDTSLASADFDNGCNAPTGIPGGAKDQVLKLVLTKDQRVVLNMDGSTYMTVLDLRKGTSCPGSPVPDACYVGVSGSRSFLDLQLSAGTYWIIIDGYDQDAGHWNLDVRVLDP